MCAAALSDDENGVSSSAEEIPFRGKGKEAKAAEVEEEEQEVEDDEDELDEEEYAHRNNLSFRRIALITRQICGREDYEP